MTGQFIRVIRRLLAYFLVIPIAIFYVLLLSGCISTSPGIPNLFLVQVTNPKVLDVEVRLGYFAICGRVSNAVTCVSTVKASVQSLTTVLGNWNAHSKDLEPLIETALSIQDRVFLKICLLVAAAVAFLLGFIVLIITPLPPRSSTSRRALVCKALLWLSVCLAFGAAIMVQQSVAALVWAMDTVPDSEAVQRVNGSTATVALHWLVFSLELIFMGAVGPIRGGDGGKGVYEGVPALREEVPVQPPPPPPPAPVVPMVPPPAMV